MKQRNYGLDLIKVWAIISVICLHQLPEISYYNINFDGSLSMFFLSFFQIIFLSCVPLFIMSSGYLLAYRNINRDHYWKYLYFIVEVLIIYTVGTFIYSFIIGGEALITSGKDLVKLILAPNYYVGLYTTLYFISPFLNKLFFSLTDKEKKLLLIVSIVFISLLKLQNLIPYLTYYSGWPTSSYPILYYFLGVYIRYFNPTLNKILNIILILTTAFLYSLFINIIMSGRTFYYILGHYEGIFTVVMTTFTFIFLYDLNLNKRFIQKLVVFISTNTFVSVNLKVVH